MNRDKKFTQWIGSRQSVIAHTIFFVLAFLLPFVGVKFDTVLLFLTTLVSLEAIYLAIFIQMTVNENTQSLEDVEEDIGEMKIDVDDISKDIDEIQHEVDEISEDIGEIEKDTDDLQTSEKQEEIDLESIQKMLKKLLDDVEKLKTK